jgi:hypothetical protein
MRISDIPIMVRPALIVGLGGTGVLICQWVEYYIRELFGCVPPFVRTLKLDTDAIDEGSPPGADLTDFVNLFNHMDVGEVVRDNAKYPEYHPHLDWMHGFRKDSTFADYGCQGIPRLGRLVFMELRETVIHEAIAARFSSLRASTEQAMEGNLARFVVAPDGAPAVHIAGSVCGGTGAGMVIDMAYNLRWWSRESFSKSAEIIGHLVLPDAFRVDPMLRPKLEATACATLEQIEFLSDERREDIPVRYRSVRTGEDCFWKDTAPFNFLYLLNGQVDTGSGDRKNLIRMIARVIRALAVEPLGQQARSDANNKLAEVLPQRDPANNRRKCFSSYGFWCGTSGHRQANVRSWILSDLKSMGSEQTRMVAGIREEVEKEIGFYLKRMPDASEIIQPILPFQWDISHAGSSQQLVAHTLVGLRQHVETSVIPTTRAEAGKVLPPDMPVQDLLAAANRMIERDVFNAGQLGHLSHVRVCFSQWIARLEELFHEHDGRHHTVNEVVGEILKEAKRSLAELSARIPPLSWTSNDVNPIIDRATDHHWRSLANALLQENRLASIKQTMRTFQLRKQSIDSLVSLGPQDLFDVGATNSSDGQGPSDQDATAEFFSSPVYRTPDTIGELDSAAMTDFRQNLIKPVLLRTVLSVDGSGPDTGSLKDTKNRLVIAIHGLEAEIERYVQELELGRWTAFKDGSLVGRSPANHEYYEGICTIWRLAEPRVDTAKSGKYSDPLEVTISQQVADSCVPVILGRYCKSSFREATVNENYRRTTGEWVQLLRLKYGFCLEALSRYKKYIAASSEYVKKMGFEYSDVWLNKKWYTCYRSALTAWKEGVQRRKHELNRRNYDAIAAKVGSFHSLMRETMERLRGQISRIGKPPLAAQLAELRQDTESRIEGILTDIPLSDRNAADERLCRCLDLTEHLIQNLQGSTGHLNAPEETVMMETLTQCREDLARLRASLNLRTTEDE